MLLFITIVAVAVAVLSVAQTWRLKRDAERRSEARVATLAAAIDPPGSGPATSIFIEREGAPTSIHPLLKVALGFGTVVALVIVLAVVGDLLGRLPSPPAEPDTASLVLLAMEHERQRQTLTVTGVVRNQGRERADRISAVVLVFDRAGKAVASGHAPLDQQTLNPGDESPFRIALLRVAEVGRYRVSFQNDEGIVRHVDRRTEAPISGQGSSPLATTRAGQSGQSQTVAAR
jgi:hypothetical protein